MCTFSGWLRARCWPWWVTRSGAVRDRVLLLDRELTSSELESASRYLNENFRGWSVERVRAELAARAERERSEYQRMLQSAEELWSRAVPDDRSTEQTLYLEGVSNLLSGADGDRTRLREMLSALEAKERLVALLGAYVDSHERSVRVVFDMEERAPEMHGLVLVAAPAMIDGAAPRNGRRHRNASHALRKHHQRSGIRGAAVCAIAWRRSEFVLGVQGQGRCLQIDTGSGRA